MSAEQFLEQALMLQKKIEAKHNEIVMLDGMLYKITAELKADVVQTTKSNDTMIEILSKIDELKKEVSAMYETYISKLNEINEVINKVKNPKQYELLHKHYILGRSWTRQMEDWDCSYTWVFQVKKKALQTVKSLLQKKS